MRSSGASSTARYGIDAQAAKAAVERVTRGAGNPDVQTRQQYIDASAGGVNALLGVVYVLLLLAIVIALMGIANTLSLSIHERTRELGLLRAVGASRRQLRSMIRGESLIVGVFATIGGLALGVFLGWGLAQAAADDAQTDVFSAPTAQLAVVLVSGRPSESWPACGQHAARHASTASTRACSSPTRTRRSTSTSADVAVAAHTVEHGDRVG